MHVQYRRCNKLERFSVAKRYLVLISRICAVLVGAIALTAFAVVCSYVYLKPSLPDVDTLRVVQLQVPLRVYTRDGKLIASIGEQRRIPVRYDQLPPKLVQARTGFCAYRNNGRSLKERPADKFFRLQTRQFEDLRLNQIAFREHDQAPRNGIGPADR